MALGAAVMIQAAPPGRPEIIIATLSKFPSESKANYGLPFTS